MGDQLNPLIIKKIWGIEIVKSSPYKCIISSISSGLGAFTTGGHRFRGLKQRICGYFCKPVYIWGTGFIKKKGKGGDGSFYRKMNFCTVRGFLSKERIESILNYKLDIPVGDGGILASYLINNPIIKKYDVGIIPHWRERDSKIFKDLQEYYPNSIIINVCDNAINVVEQISKCRVIVSSSLHGLIVADSFNIPNIHIVVSNKLLGDGFKFDDYYSAYHLNHIFFDLSKEKAPSIEWIINNYAIKEEDVSIMKEQMIASFPFVYDKDKKSICLKKL